jgi:hypothetical protein
MLEWRAWYIIAGILVELSVRNTFDVDDFIPAISLSIAASCACLSSNVGSVFAILQGMKGFFRAGVKSIKSINVVDNG